ncbi:MAG TPA: type II toxin-antitoxin system prevent-host-death family antitoxin [Candidatus Krumholzibacteria bacterium]
MKRNTELGIFDVKTHFSEVVERVLREGRPITVTRRGKPVVDIVPSASAAHSRMTREEALAALEVLRREVPQISLAEIRSMTDEGRDRCLDS